MIEQIKRVLRQHGRLAISVDSLTAEADLYSAGMTSHASVSVMLALERAFNVEFPDRMLRRAVFESMSSIEAALEELTASGR